MEIRHSLCFLGSLFEQMFALLFCFQFISTLTVLSADDSELANDIFPPFGHMQGPHRGHRFVRECQPAKYKNVTHELFPPHNSSGYEKPEPMEVRYFSKLFKRDATSQVVHGHHVIVNDPVLTISVLEPQMVGGCPLKLRETVASSANQKQCLFAVNAGFFNVTDGSCMGNVVSDGREAFNSGGIQNTHFGITRDGSLFFGYIAEVEPLNEIFEQLVGGVIWLVRNGENYIDTSKVAECPDMQSTASLQGYIDVLSARTAIGHDSLGRVHIVQVEGKTFARGLSLNEFAELLISLGIVSAVNLDGGGSATSILHGTLINYPSDTRKVDGFTYNVERNVSTVICVSDYRCVPACGSHGQCVRGVCHCDGNWHGASCQLLLCSGRNCSGHGECSEAGCHCHPGYDGENCSAFCPEGQYGLGCQSMCRCPGNQTSCNHVSGQCPCPPGYTGQSCESICPLGRFGEACEGVCRCDDGCYCDPIDGSCEPQSSSAYWKVGQCYGNLAVVQRGMNLITPQELRYWLTAFVTLSIVTSLSLIINFYFFYRCNCSVRRMLLQQKQQHQFTRLPLFQEDDDDNEVNEERTAGIPLMNLDANDSPQRVRK